MSELFRDTNIEYFGINTTSKIKDMLDAELPLLTVDIKVADFLFSMEDESLLHYEFQSTFQSEDLVRFSDYDALIYKKYKKKVQTVIIYSADVTKIDEILDMGSLVYTPMSIMLCKYDGNKIYEKLENKVRLGQELADRDMMDLLLLPLMKYNMPKKELALKSIELAKMIKDDVKRDTCITSSFAFSLKYFTKEEIKEILEGLRMVNAILGTGIDTLIEVITEDIEQSVEKNKMEIAIKLLKKGMSVDDVADTTELDIGTVEALKNN